MAGPSLAAACQRKYLSTASPSPTKIETLFRIA